MAETLDLNNPPKKPYVYQEYPRVVYGAEGKTKIVNSDEEREAALESGFALSPDALDVPVIAEEVVEERKGKKK